MQAVGGLSVLVPYRTSCIANAATVYPTVVFMQCGVPPLSRVRVL